MKRLFTSLICMLLAASLAAGGTSCAMRIKAEELTADYERTPSDSGKRPSGDWVDAVNGFSLSLLRETGADPAPDAGGNVALCPLSAACVLGLTAHGADGQTLAELETVLGQSAADMGRGARAWMDSIPTDLSVRLGTAHSVWIRDGLSVRPSFLQNAVDDYGAACFRAPFDTGTVKDVNRWVSRETGGMIEGLLDPGRVPEDAALFLVNAVGFDAGWAEPYQPKEVKSLPFTNADGSEAEPTTLCSNESVFLSGDGFTGFSRPYEGGRFAFVGLLPDDPDVGGEHGLDALLSSLDGAGWTEAWTSREAAAVVKVRIPSFRLSAQPDLKGALERMGVCDLFSRESCDLSRLTEEGEVPLFCADVVQKTVVELDSHGTKAASASAGVFAPRSAGPVGGITHKVYLDRPFVYLIVDTDTGLILFAGCVRSL